MQVCSNHGEQERVAEVERERAVETEIANSGKSNGNREEETVN